MGSMLLMLSGLANDDRNSQRSSSFPFHSFGMCPLSNSWAGRERLVNVSFSWIVPFPQGDADAARKWFLLNLRRLRSIEVLSRIVSH